MCYDIKTSKETQLKKAVKDGNHEAIQNILEALKKISPNEYFHISGFAHPKLIIYAHENNQAPIISQWGLIAPWVKNHEQKLKLWNNTLNARSETMFEKPSFKKAASSNRGILFVDGFFEHHHKSGKTFPYYIYHQNGDSLPLGVICNEWIDNTTGEILNSFSIVTTKGNKLMSSIHNNPKISEPRMPLIIPEEQTEIWLNSHSSEENIKAILQPHSSNNLKAHSVKRIKGKNAVGNSPEAILEENYPELNIQGELF